MFGTFINPGIPPIIFWLFVSTAIILQGISKSGLTGAGVLSLPMMMMVMPVDKVAATMLPLLCLCDYNAVYHHRHNVVWKQVWIIFLPSLIGIGIGSYLWWRMGQAGVDTYSIPLKRFVGVVSLIFGIYIVAKDRSLGWVAHHKGGPKMGISAGIVAGITSTLVHAASPVVSLYLFSQGLGKVLFVGTMAWTFAFINTTKLPSYALNGMLPREVLLFCLLLVPLIPIGSYMGKWLLHAVSEKIFNRVMMVLAIFAGLQLLFNIQLLPWLVEKLG